MFCFVGETFLIQQINTAHTKSRQITLQKFLIVRKAKNKLNFFFLLYVSLSRVHLFTARQSRSRCRVDRETVLKINRNPRRHRSCCDYQWPPPNVSRPHVNTNTQRFDNNALSKTQVAEIRDFFDNYESNMREMLNVTYERSRRWYNNLSDNMTSSKSTENLKFEKHDLDVAYGIDKMLYGQNLCDLKMAKGGHEEEENQSRQALSFSTPNLLPSQRPASALSHRQQRPPLRKYFYLPEEKIHSNELVKIRQHFDKSYDKQNNSSGILKTFHRIDDDDICDDYYAEASGNQQNKIGTTKNHKSTNNIDDANDFNDTLKLHRCNDRSTCSIASPIASTASSSLNKYDQKILQMNDLMSVDMIKINESHNKPQAKPLMQTTLEEMKPSNENRINSTTPVLSALIKNDNAISHHRNSDRNNLKCEENPLKQLDAQSSSSQAIANETTISNETQHNHCKDLKPIKSSEIIIENTTTSTTLPLCERKMQKHQQHRQQEEQKQEQERHNSILMNNDCKLHEIHQQHERMQDEQTSSDGTCRDKYCKNFETYGKSINITERSCKNDLKINEISTNNSRINSKNNLNLDLYFDKELSVWMSMNRHEREKNVNEKVEMEEERRLSVDEIEQQRMKTCSDNDDEIAITNIQIISDVECNSCEKLSNENEMMEEESSYNDNTSNSSDSTSSFSSSTTRTNLKSDSSLIGTHHQQQQNSIVCKRRPIVNDDDNGIRITSVNNSNKKSMFFTDGMYIYGPYDFDLFANVFYQFDNEFARTTNDDEATTSSSTHMQHHDNRNSIINTQLLKNHDDDDDDDDNDVRRAYNNKIHPTTTAAAVVITSNIEQTKEEEKVSFVRDMDPMPSSSIRTKKEEYENNNNIDNKNNNKNGNNDRVDIEINVTNCSDDDERDFIKWNDEDIFHDKNFNYERKEEANSDRNLIDLMDEGDNYVSKKSLLNDVNESDHDLHVHPTIMRTKIYAEASNVPLLLTTATNTTTDITSPNNFQQFNYERDKIVEITDENESEYLCNTDDASIQPFQKQKPTIIYDVDAVDECMNVTINKKASEIVSNDKKVSFANSSGKGINDNQCDDTLREIRKLKEHEIREILSEFYRDKSDFRDFKNKCHW